MITVRVAQVGESAVNVTMENGSTVKEAIMKAGKSAEGREVRIGSRVLDNLNEVIDDGVIVFLSKRNQTNFTVAA
jgi:hypothetical protein